MEKVAELLSKDVVTGYVYGYDGSRKEYYVRRHFVAKGNVKILPTVLLELRQINPNNVRYYY